MVNFGPRPSVPERFRGRLLHQHNPNVTLMRVTLDEGLALAGIIADKLNASDGKTALFIPLGGISALDAPGQPFFAPDTLKAMAAMFRVAIDPERVELHELPFHINDSAFAVAMADKLLQWVLPAEV